MVVAIKIIQVLLALSLLVLVHEFGHFIFARLFKIRVEKFYLFFNPGFSLFKYKPKGSETEYGLGWLPLGGYCKISGMIDESMDREAMAEEPKPWEFRSKPAWQRFFVMFGGVFFNFILAILIYSGILFTWGEEYIKNSDVKEGFYFNELALEMGFKHGDQIVAFNDIDVTQINERDLQIVMLRNQATTATIIRDGEQTTLPLSDQYLSRALNSPGMFSLIIPPIIGQVVEESPNRELLKEGDIILSIDGERVITYQEVSPKVSAKNGDDIALTIKRGEEEIELIAKLNEEGYLGIVFGGDLSEYYTITTLNYGLFGSLQAGTNKTFSTIGGYLKELKLIFSPKTKAYKSVGSFITIGKIFPGTWEWYPFWNITAFLSVMLAVLNLLPIPALDGGHIIFLLYEVVTRRKPSDTVVEYAQVVGMLILLAIMFLAFGNDIYRLFN